MKYEQWKAKAEEDFAARKALIESLLVPDNIFELNWSRTQWKIAGNNAYPSKNGKNLENLQERDFESIPFILSKIGEEIDYQVCRVWARDAEGHYRIVYDTIDTGTDRRGELLC